MVTRVVVVKLKDGVTEEQRQDLLAAFRALNDVPVIRSAKAGENVNGRSKGEYQIIATLTFDKVEDIPRYEPHELHTNLVRNHLVPTRESTLLLDFES